MRWCLLNDLDQGVDVATDGHILVLCDTVHMASAAMIGWLAELALLVGAELDKEPLDAFPCLR